VVVSYQIQACARHYIGSTLLYPVFGIDWSEFLPGCWFHIVFWPTAGATIAGVLIYIRQLMRL
jgi:hypothetical protein